MANPRFYDYIIVGGGTAGCVMASRLLEYKSTAQILVIEAGHNVNDRTDILHFQSLNFFGGEFDWGYKSVPQKNSDGRKISLVSGRALGGSSVVNGCKLLGWPSNLESSSNRGQVRGFAERRLTSMIGPIWLPTTVGVTKGSFLTSK